MKDFWTMTRVVFSAVGGWLGYFMGGCDGLMAALILFVVADYTTGVMCAVVDKKLSSEKAYHFLKMQHISDFRYRKN